MEVQRILCSSSSEYHTFLSKIQRCVFENFCALQAQNKSLDDRNIEIITISDTIDNLFSSSLVQEQLQNDILNIMAIDKTFLRR